MKKIDIKINKEDFKKKLGIKDGLPGEKGDPGLNGITPKKGVDYFDGLPGERGSPDTPNEVVDKINIATKKIDPKTVRGLLELFNSVDQIIRFPQGNYSTGGANQLKFRDSTGSIISAYVTDLQFGTGITPVYTDGKITITASGGGSTTITATQVGYGDVSNALTSDANFTTNFTTFERTMQTVTGGDTYGLYTDEASPLGTHFAGSKITNTSGTFHNGVINPGNNDIPGSIGTFAGGIDTLGNYNFTIKSPTIDYSPMADYLGLYELQRADVAGFSKKELADVGNLIIQGYRIIPTSISLQSINATYLSNPYGYPVDITQFKTTANDAFTTLFGSGTTYKVRSKTGVTQSIITHTGGGVSDISVTGTWLGSANASFTATIIGNDGRRLKFDGGMTAGENFQIGDTVTGSISGHSGIVAYSDSTHVGLYNTTGTFQLNDILTGALGEVSTVITQLQQTGDMVSIYTITEDDLIDIGFVSIIVSSGDNDIGGITTTWATSTLHTPGDTWTWTETLTFDNLLDIDPTTGITKIKATAEMQLVTPEIIANTATLGDVFTLQDVTTGEGEWKTPTGGNNAGSVGVMFNGNGGVITTGVNGSGSLSIPYSGTITGWTISSINPSTGAALSGSIVIDTWKDTYANFPPTVADTIWATKPTLTAQSKNTATGLSIAVTAGDMLIFNVDSATTCQNVTLTIFITKS